MKKISPYQLLPGMKLAKDVYTFGDHLLLPAGSVLDDYSIAKLQESVANVSIEESATRSEEIQNSPEFQNFSKAFVENVSAFKETLSVAVTNYDELDTDSLLNNTLSMMDNARGALHIFDMLHNMRHVDDLTFAHSLNVALICNVLAEWQGMSKEDIELATLCGLLHDIGKLVLPEEIINKKEPLTFEEKEIFKKHPYEGFKILKSKGVDPRIANAALMHHERCDGKGYPVGYSADKIDEFAKLVSIANDYDISSSPKTDAKNPCPFSIIQMLEKEGLRKYDSFFVMTFLENIINTYISNTVQLSDGRIGEIVYVNKNYPSRPLIKCANNTFIDLTKEPLSVYIEKIL